MLRAIPLRSGGAASLLMRAAESCPGGVGGLAMADHLHAANASLTTSAARSALSALGAGEHRQPPPGACAGLPKPQEGGLGGRIRTCSAAAATLEGFAAGPRLAPRVTGRLWPISQKRQ